MSTGIITSAHNQWSNRPADERHWTLNDLNKRATELANASREIKVGWRDLRANVLDGQLIVQARSGIPAALTHHSFGQLARLAGAPSEYLRELPPTLAAQNLNYGLKLMSEGRTAEDKFGIGLFANIPQGTAPVTLRALTTESYGRTWDHELIKRYLMPLEADGWVTPPANPPSGIEGVPTRIATEADCGPHTFVQPGQTICPSGLYKSDHDFFAFMVDKAHPLNLGGNNPGYRFILFSSDELGKSSVWICFGAEDKSCGNHIIWGARDVINVRIRHIKSKDSKDVSGLFERIEERLEVAMNKMDDGDLEKVAKGARTHVLGKDKNETIETVVKFAKTHGLGLLSKTRIEDAYDTTDSDDRWGSPNTVWGMLSGLTYNSQVEFAGYADKRTEVDAQAGRLLKLVEF